MSKKLTTEEFIEKSRKIHGNKYDYSKVKYEGARSKVKIICPMHGVFEQRSDGHLESYGCFKCGRGFKLVYGIGRNDAPYEVSIVENGKRIICPYYTKWCSMLARCYSKRYHKRRPSYIGASVCDEWLSFMSFKTWMIKQDWKNKELDKDILTYGTDIKIYSPETCMFVSSEINSLLLDNKTTRGKYPQGVCLNKVSNKYISQLGSYGKNKYLGSFNRVSDAYKVYIKEKIALIVEVALDQEDKLKNGLLTVAEVMKVNYAKGIRL